jgi:allophanate hydrolase subunit 2
LGQIKPGDTVRFSAVSIDEARRALIALEEKVQAFEENLR